MLGLVLQFEDLFTLAPLMQKKFAERKMFSKAKKVNNLVDRGEVDIHCKIDTKPDAKLKDFKVKQREDIFLRSTPGIVGYSLHV